jgi:hypothetical protein
VPVGLLPRLRSSDRFRRRPVRAAAIMAPAIWLEATAAHLTMRTHNTGSRSARALAPCRVAPCTHWRPVRSVYCRSCSCFDVAMFGLEDALALAAYTLDSDSAYAHTRWPAHPPAGTPMRLSVSQPGGGSSAVYASVGAECEAGGEGNVVTNPWCAARHGCTESQGMLGAAGVPSVTCTAARSPPSPRLRRCACCRVGTPQCAAPVVALLLLRCPYDLACFMLHH